MPYLPDQGQDFFPLTQCPCSWNNCCAVPGPSSMLAQDASLSKALQNKAPPWPGGPWTPFSVVAWIYKMNGVCVSSFPSFQVRAALWDIVGVGWLLLRQSSTDYLDLLFLAESLIHNCQHAGNFTTLLCILQEGSSSPYSKVQHTWGSKESPRLCKAQSCLGTCLRT